MSRKAGKFEWNMVELSDGITTSAGNWYRTSSEYIEKYIPGLLKEVELEEIIKNADYWVSGSNGLSMMLYLVLVMLGVSPIASSVSALIFFLIWYSNTSAFVNPSLNGIIKVLNMDGVLYVSTAAVLIYCSMEGNTVATWLGLILFFLFKVGLLSLSLKWIAKKSKKEKVDREDRILNMLLVRYGMREGLYTGNVQQMQDELINTVNYHKTRKKKK